MNKHTITANMIERLQADLNGVSYGLESNESYTMKSARSDILFFIEEAKKEADEHGLHWLAIVSVIAVIKGVSRTALMKACNKAIDELEVLRRHQREQAAELEAQEVKPMDKATAKRIADLKETIGLMQGDLRYCNTKAQVNDLCALIDVRKAELAELEAPQDAQEAPQEAQGETQGNTKDTFINRCVIALDKADYGTHNVYIHFFRISYGVWMDAKEVVNAGSLADYLESLGLNEADVNELMAQDWDCQDAEGLALKCLGNYGSFDWKLMGELLEAAVECGEDVVHAALSAGIPATEAGDKYLGQWESMEDYAYDHWESCGLLESIPEAARGYLDWEAIARDIRFNGDVCESKGHYFCAC